MHESLDWRRTLPVEMHPSPASTCSVSSLSEALLWKCPNCQAVKLFYSCINTSTLLSSMSMASHGPLAKPQMPDTTYIGGIWKEAVDQYEKTTAVKLESLDRANSVDEILDGMREREKKFKDFRHDGSKLDKFRTLLGKSLKPIDMVGDVAAAASSAVRRQTSVPLMIDHVSCSIDDRRFPPAPPSSQLSDIYSRYAPRQYILTG